MLVLNTLLNVLLSYQVVVGSFLPSNQHEQKPKKPKNESVPATIAPNSTIVAEPASNAEKEDGISGLSQQNTSALKPNLTNPAFRRENWATMQEPRNSPTDINISLPAG